jgi:hypothetical protein
MGRSVAEVYGCVSQAAPSLEITVEVRSGVVTYASYPLLIRELSERWLIADGLGRSLVLHKETGNFGLSFVYRSRRYHFRQLCSRHLYNIRVLTRIWVAI